MPRPLERAAGPATTSGVHLMAVYVDDMQAPFGRMKMCHMMADTTEELLAMADRIGVARRWLQKRGTHHEHFDIAQGKRALAVRMGAVEITRREVFEIIQARRAAGFVVQAFPPASCNAWEDCKHDGVCHDPLTCGAVGPNHRCGDDA
jgi:hypothetical protein